MASYYVSNGAANGIPAGSATGAGSKASPFLTLGQALAVAGNGDTIYLNNGTYSSTSGQYVITAGVDIESVSSGKATITGSSGLAPVAIATTGGQTVTFGAVNIDAGNAAQNAILLKSESRTDTLVLNGTALSNATGYGIGGDGGQTRTNVSATGVTYAAGTSLGLLGLTSLAAGAIDIQGGKVAISDQTSVAASQQAGTDGGGGSIALIDATTTDVSVHISGVTASASLDKADSLGEGIAIFNVAGAVIQDNDITLAGSAATAENIRVGPDTSNPLQASGAVIDHNTLENFDVSSSSTVAVTSGASENMLILVGEDFSPGPSLWGYADNAQIYDNVGSGDAVSQAGGLHGILVGWQSGALVSGNVMTSAFVAFGMKGDFGNSLVEDNVDYDSSRYSLYQKAGSGVEWLNNASYNASGFDPYGLYVGPDHDLGGLVYYASGGEAGGNLIVVSGGDSTPAAFIAPGDSFAAVGAGISGVDDEGTLVVSSGGVVTSATIFAGGIEQVLSGGSAAGVYIASGGTLSVNAGAAATGVSVKAGGSILGPVVLTADAVDQAVFSGVIIDAGLTVASGGEALGERIASGGVEQVLSGGIERGGVVSGGAELTISAGGRSVDALVSGGIERALAGGTTTGTQVSADGEELVSSGGVASATEVESGGLAYAAAFGLVSSAAVSAGGSLYVLSNGSATGTTLLAGGVEILSSGGLAAETSIRSGGTLALENGTASDVKVASGGGLDTTGEVKSNLTLKAVTSTTVVSGVTLSSGAFEGLYGATVLSGATVSVAAGAGATALSVEAGAVVKGPGDLDGVDKIAGRASGVTVANGGDLVLLSGGGASGVTLATETAALATELQIEAGAAATGTVIGGYGEVLVRSGGIASATSVLSAGGEVVLAGGVASATTLSAGGKVYVSSGGVTRATIASAGGIEGVLAGGVASGTSVLDGGFEYLLARGTAKGTLVSRGGEQIISSGGVADDAVLSSGGKAYVSSGGVADATTISSDGIQGVVAGGVADGTRILSGGAEFLYGESIDETVSNGGSETLSSGGAATGLTVLSGGLLVDDGEVRIAGAGTLEGTLSGSGSIVETGAGDLVIGGAGAAFTGKAAIEGGVIELATSGALGAGYVQFVAPASGSAVLQIDAADAPAAGGNFADTLSNFSGASEEIDLRSLAYVAGAAATISGSTLVLTDGGTDYRFNLAGSVGATYAVASDGHGGTLIDPQVANFAQTMAGFGARGGADALPMSFGVASVFGRAINAPGAAAHGRAGQDL